MALGTNMIGDLLYTSRSVQFGFLRVNGNTNFFGLASTTIVNSSVAENNSPLPEDRIYVRYNFFSNGQQVTGLSPTVRQIVPGDAFGSAPILLQLPQTKHYDVNMYTIGAEKTFLDGLMSVEVRLPVVTSLAPSNVFSVGSITSFNQTVDINGNQTFNVRSTPQNYYSAIQIPTLAICLCCSRGSLPGQVRRPICCGWCRR